RPRLPAARDHGETRVSAAQWRRAMNSAATASVRAPAPLRAVESTATHERGDRLTRSWVATWRDVRPHHLVVLVFLLVYPAVASPFFTYQIGAQALGLGLI